MQWLDSVPLCVVQAHVAMLPRLRAEEAIAAASVVGVGSALERGGDWVKQKLEEWDAEQNGVEPPRPQRASRLSMGALKGMGHQVTLVKRVKHG